eukprot:COSAG02_NODE_5538_length_4245_cov_120.115533_3_plen_137_part_00
MSPGAVLLVLPQQELGLTPKVSVFAGALFSLPTVRLLAQKRMLRRVKRPPGYSFAGLARPVSPPQQELGLTPKVSVFAGALFSLPAVRLLAQKQMLRRVKRPSGYSFAGLARPVSRALPRSKTSTSIVDLRDPSRS